MPHELTASDCCNIGRVLLSKAIGGNTTDFTVELTLSDELLFSEIMGERICDTLYKGLRAAHELRVEFKCTYSNRVFTSVAVKKPKNMSFQTGSRWVDAIRSAPTSADRHDLIQKPPIIVWFQKNWKEIRRLIKVTTRPDDDIWIIHERSASENEEGLAAQLLGLDDALRYLTSENGWVLCEFENQIEFYTEALRYLQGD